jgi:hypothetical protein
MPGVNSIALVHFPACQRWVNIGRSSDWALALELGIDCGEVLLQIRSGDMVIGPES